MTSKTQPAKKGTALYRLNEKAKKHQWKFVGTSLQPVRKKIGIAKVDKVGKNIDKNLGLYSPFQGGAGRQRPMEWAMDASFPLICGFSGLRNTHSQQ